jgi:hypothetical protein
VSTGGARRGRRDNGLDAADYAAAGDVDPRVGEHLLDVFAAEGIAAYLQPSADLNPILRATTFPGRPTDRLYVDRAHLDEARATLNRITGGVSPMQPAPQYETHPDATASQRDVDAEWARIIAGFNTTVDPTAPPWPAVEGDDPTRAPELPEARPDPPQPRPSTTDVPGTSLSRRHTEPDPSLLDGLDTFGAGLDGPDDDERYIPPPPPPFPRISKYAVAGVVAIIVGFILFMRPSLLPVDRDLVTLIGFCAVIGGAATLVLRLRADKDDDDFDDGAVV